MRFFRFLLLSLIATPALAHIDLTAPANFQVTDSLGSPNKTSPCGGAGTATGAITTVTAGSQLTVSWSEPVPHPGHFRIGIASTQTDFSTPTPVVSANNCVSAPIQTNPTYPTLVDGLFPHSSTTGPWTTTVTVPLMSCDHCFLQLMQFMSSHTPPCFYYQCAELRIVMPADGGTGGGSGTGGGAASGGGSATGGGGATGAGGGGASGGGSATGGGTTSSCGPQNCNGCCSIDGRCQSGTTVDACGVGGLSCLACSGQTDCDVGRCKPAAGCGCTALDGSAAVALLGFALALLRRSRV